MRSLAPLVAFCLTVACGTATSSSGAQMPTSGPCPTTTPPPVALTPPPSTGTSPNPTLIFRAGPDSFLYGNDALIVLLPNDATFHPSDPQRGLRGGVKLGWWRMAHGDLVIATRRLDATSPSLSADVPSGYGDSGFQATGINFSDSGCWQVTGTVAGKALTFVVNVAAQ